MSDAQTNEDAAKAAAAKAAAAEKPVDPAPKAEAKKNGKPKVDEAAPGMDFSNQETVTVETTGNFQLQDPFTQQLIAHEGETEVVRTQFVNDAIEDGRLKEV